MVHRAHVEDARRSGEEQIRDSQLGREAQRARIVRGFQRPDPFREPLEQREPIRLVAKDRLAQMRMGLDEARNHQLPGAIEYGGPGWGTQPRRDPDDPSLLDEKVGMDDAPGRVHGDEGAAPQEHRATSREHAART